MPCSNCHSAGRSLRTKLGDLSTRVESTELAMQSDPDSDVKSSPHLANPTPLTPAAPSCAQPSLPYLVARFLLTSPHPHLPLSQASRRHVRDLSSACRHFAFGSDFEPRGPKESSWRRILRSFA